MEEQKTGEGKISGNPEGHEEEGFKAAEPAEAPQVLRDVRTELSSIGTLFSRSFEIYKARFPLFVRIVLLFGALPALLSLLGESAGELGALSSAVVGAGFAVAFVLYVIGQIAIIFAITKEVVGLGEIIRRAWGMFFSYLWVSVLFLFVTVSGFVLLIIPGLVFIVWFGFAPFVLVAEDKRGIDALLRSKEYVKGRWFPVFWRILVIWLISMLLSYVPYAGAILSIFFAPFLLVWENLVYAELRKIKGGLSGFEPSRSDKASWLIIAILGLLIAILIAALVAKYAPDKYEVKGLGISTQLGYGQPAPVHLTNHLFRIGPA